MNGAATRGSSQFQSAHPESGEAADMDLPQPVLSHAEPGTADHPAWLRGRSSPCHPRRRPLADRPNPPFSRMSRKHAELPLPVIGSKKTTINSLTIYSGRLEIALPSGDHRRRKTADACPDPRHAVDRGGDAHDRRLDFSLRRGRLGIFLRFDQRMRGWPKPALRMACLPMSGAAAPDDLNPNAPLRR